MDAAIDSDVERLNRNAAIASLVALVVVIGLVISLVSRALTTPLIWMGEVADKITNNAGSDLGRGIDATADPAVSCSPKVRRSPVWRPPPTWLCPSGAQVPCAPPELPCHVDSDGN